MKQGETESGNETHATVELLVPLYSMPVSGLRDWYSHSIQHDKVHFILHDFVAPPTRHLGDPEDTSDEDGGKRDEHGADEQLESRVGKKVNDRLTEIVSSLISSIEIFSGQGDKHEQGDYLEYDARHHGVVAVGRTGVRIGGRGESSPGALEDQGKEIAQNKDPGVVLGWNAGILLPDGQNDVLQGEVYGSGEEGLGRD